MVARLRALVLTGLVVAGCAGEPPSSASPCPAGSTSAGFTLPSGFGLTISESGLRAAYGAVRDFFTRNPGATDQSGKAQAADLAANAAAKEAAAPMTDEQKRALRAQAGEWVDTYTEKCRP